MSPRGSGPVACLSACPTRQKINKFINNLHFVFFLVCFGIAGKAPNNDRQNEQTVEKTRGNDEDRGTGEHPHRVRRHQYHHYYRWKEEFKRGNGREEYLVKWRCPPGGLATLWHPRNLVSCHPGPYTRTDKFDIRRGWQSLYIGRWTSKKESG